MFIYTIMRQIESDSMPKVLWLYLHAEPVRGGGYGAARQV